MLLLEVYIHGLRDPRFKLTHRRLIREPRPRLMGPARKGPWVAEAKGWGSEKRSEGLQPRPTPPTPPLRRNTPPPRAYEGCVPASTTGWESVVRGSGGAPGPHMTGSGRGWSRDGEIKQD